jgi:ceramide glucosyltransferase
MGEILLGALVAVSFAVSVAMEFTKRRIVRRAPPNEPKAFPPVSVLKPLRGADPGLEANLETSFRLDYPAFEVVLGAADADDPALAIARRVAARHPHVPSRIVVDDRRVGVNPKVNNLSNLLRRARHELVVVSDSNVALPRDWLRDMAAHHAQPGVGLVTSLFRGEPGATLGARVEAVQLDAFVAGGVAVASAAGRVCVVGKSMMLLRRDLGRIGGLRFLGRYLAEDQVCGEEIAAKGLRVVVARRVVENRLGRLSLADAASRHLRWARIRRAMNPAAFACELLLCPVALALAGAALLRTPASAALLAGAVAVKVALDACAVAGLGGRVDALLPIASVVRDLGAALLWPLAFTGSAVAWRGSTYRVGPRTLLAADGSDVARTPVPARRVRAATATPAAAAR